MRKIKFFSFVEAPHRLAHQKNPTFFYYCKKLSYYILDNNKRNPTCTHSINHLDFFLKLWTLNQTNFILVMNLKFTTLNIKLK